MPDWLSSEGDKAAAAASGASGKLTGLERLADSSSHCTRCSRRHHSRRLVRVRAQ